MTYKELVRDLPMVGHAEIFFGLGAGPADEGAPSCT